METYKKLHQLGKGTFGTVYLCERLHNQLKIVVKEIYQELDTNQQATAKNEVAILKALNNPNVIQYYDSFVRNNTFFIVMEYARHGNLYEFICNRKPDLLPKEQVLTIFCQILMGLDHIHSRKIMHRDLKCENIFLTGINADIIKIGDFGISKILETHQGKANTTIGTTNYIAPEICCGEPYDIKSDIWSLGCILYELCALERLFQGSVANVVLSIKAGHLKMIKTEIYGNDMQRIINSTVQANPAERPTTTKILTDPFIFPFRSTLMFNLGNVPPA